MDKQITLSVSVILAAIADITARKQAEVDRRRYDRELKSIFEALPDSYFRLDPDGIIRYYHANPIAMGELYVLPEHSLGQRMIDVLPSEQAELFAAKIKEQQSCGKLITFEYPSGIANGERYYEARLANLADSGDMIVLIRNITERKRLEQQLQQAQKMEALGQLTGGIAHDFNNSLAAILGYSNLALEQCVSDPSDKLARYLGEVISVSERARDLIAKMLAYSRTSSAVASVPIDIVAEVEKAVAMLSFAVPAGIEVVTRIEPSLPSVRIDPIEIQQVLINLAVNSRDAIGEQGRIDITLKRAKVNHEACAICDAIIDGDYVVLEVKDTGNGIPPPIQQRIFDPFFTTKAVGKGSGLGLSMVRSVVVKNNAHLLMETSLERGTCFRLLFPFAYARTVASVAPMPALILPVTKRWRVWVVEDQASLAAYYLELLQEQGYLVTVFTDPTEALHAFQLDSECLDLLITDQTMPYLSGVELAGVMLANRPKLPVILITGHNDAINDSEAKRLGIRCYLNKPVDGNRLLDILATEFRAIGHTDSANLSCGLHTGSSDLIGKPYFSDKFITRFSGALNRRCFTDQVDDTESMLFTLAGMAEAKDKNVDGHCSRLAHISSVLGQALGLDPEHLRALRRGGVIHDIGKLAIPDSILLKPGKLSEDEWLIMRRHPEIGARLVMNLKGMDLPLSIIRHHHEHWDGSGYPDGLAGKNIPLLARVFQLADVYDALISERPYKPAMPREQAIRILEDEIAKGWRDPELSAVFLDIVRQRPHNLELPKRIDTILNRDLFTDIAWTGELWPGVAKG